MKEGRSRKGCLRNQQTWMSSYDYFLNSFVFLFLRLPVSFWNSYKPTEFTEVYKIEYQARTSFYFQSLLRISQILNYCLYHEEKWIAEELRQSQRTDAQHLGSSYRFYAFELKISSLWRSFPFLGINRGQIIYSWSASNSVLFWH